MNDSHDGPVVHGRDVIEDLHELLRALDRRVASPGRAGEDQIGRDAQALKDQALSKIAELERAPRRGAIPDVLGEGDRTFDSGRNLARS